MNTVAQADQPAAAPSDAGDSGLFASIFSFASAADVLPAGDVGEDDQESQSNEEPNANVEQHYNQGVDSEQATTIVSGAGNIPVQQHQHQKPHIHPQQHQQHQQQSYQNHQHPSQQQQHHQHRGHAAHYNQQPQQHYNQQPQYNQQPGQHYNPAQPNHGAQVSVQTPVNSGAGAGSGAGAAGASGGYYGIGINGFSSVEAAVHIGTQEFIKGFVAGQVTLGVLVFLLVRTFFFQRSAEVKGEHLLQNRKNNDQRNKNNPTLNNQANEYNILAKTGYDLHRHPDESCDWLNVFIAQILSRYRADSIFTDKVISAFDAALNGEARPSFMGYLYITDFGLGREFPHLSNCRIRFAEKTGNLRIEVSFSFDDQITLGVDTHLLINWPKTQIAALPISLTVSVVKFNGRIAIEIITDQESSETYAYISILPGYLLEFDVRSLLGNRTKVKDLPKLTFLISSKLQSIFAEELVYPCGQKIKIPMLHDLEIPFGKNKKKHKKRHGDTKKGSKKLDGQVPESKHKSSSINDVDSKSDRSSNKKSQSHKHSKPSSSEKQDDEMKANEILNNDESNQLLDTDSSDETTASSYSDSIMNESGLESDDEGDGVNNNNGNIGN